MSRGGRSLLVAAAVLATAALAVGIGNTDLWPPDETRVAEVARELPGWDRWLVPELNGEPFLEEPPLFYWLQAGAYRFEATPSALGARLPAAAAAILGVLVTSLLARAVGASAAIAALVLATAPEWWWMGRSGTPDTANATATALALLAFLHGWRRGSGAAVFVAVGAAAIAFALKSFLGVGLAVLTAGIFLALRGPEQLSPRTIGWAGLALIAVAVTWLLAVGHAAGGGGVSFFVLTNHLGRLVGSAREGHLRPLWYYGANGALDLLPWSIVLPAATAAAWRERNDPAKLFVLLWAGTMAVALSAAATKRAHYLLPAYPAFAVLIALWWAPSRDGRFDRATRALLGAIALVLYPIATLMLAGLDPAVLTTTAGATKDRAWTIAGMLLRARPGALAWVAGLVAMLGAVVVVAQRASRRRVAVAALGLSATIVHLLVTFVVLPRFNVVASARPLAEALGRAADEGVAVVAFGFDNREQLSPFLFYGRHSIVEVQRADEAAAQVGAARACVLMPAEAYRGAPASLRTLAASTHRVGELSLVLVSGPKGGCPEEVTGDASVDGAGNAQHEGRGGRHDEPPSILQHARQ